MEIIIITLVIICLIPVSFVLSFLLVFGVIIPIALIFLPSSWVFSKEHTKKFGRVYGIKNKLRHHFMNFNHPNYPRHCECKKCNFDGVFEGLTFEEILYYPNKPPKKILDNAITNKLTQL